MVRGRVGGHTFTYHMSGKSHRFYFAHSNSYQLSHAISFGSSHGVRFIIRILSTHSLYLSSTLLVCMYIVSKPFVLSRAKILKCVASFSSTNLSLFKSLFTVVCPHTVHCRVMSLGKSLHIQNKNSYDNEHWLPKYIKQYETGICQRITQFSCMINIQNLMHLGGILTSANHLRNKDTPCYFQNNLDKITVKIITSFFPLKCPCCLLHMNKT